MKNSETEVCLANLISSKLVRKNILGDITALISRHCIILTFQFAQQLVEIKI